MMRIVTTKAISSVVLNEKRCGAKDKRRGFHMQTELPSTTSKRQSTLYERPGLKRLGLFSADPKARGSAGVALFAEILARDAIQTLMRAKSREIKRTDARGLIASAEARPPLERPRSRTLHAGACRCGQACPTLCGRHCAFGEFPYLTCNMRDAANLSVAELD
jgi:hypothetical protein